MLPELLAWFTGKANIGILMDAPKPEAPPPA
jgi:hypothetical protein